MWFVYLHCRDTPEIEKKVSQILKSTLKKYYIHFFTQIFIINDDDTV